ncbi:MAG: Abi family protein [Clostridiales bacterium]|nr:Abi family protein [Clostridiales bacterium]
MEMPTTYDKPFKSYEELIAILESRHIIVDNKDFAMRALENFSYYGIINGYKNTFIQLPDSDNFIPGTKFEELYTLHIVDTALNNIIFKYILFLEKALKSRISYLVSEKYGVFTDYEDMSCMNPNDYLHTRHYSNSTGRRRNILRRLKENISETGRNPSMVHYLNHHNHVPAWILTTNISYGLTIEWYNLLKSNDKQAICDTFISPGLCTAEKTKEFVHKAFDITKEYRNKIAHGNRTFSIISLPQLPKEQVLAFTFNSISETEYNNRMGQNDTMAVLLALMVMLCDPYIITNLHTELTAALSPYKNVLFNNKTIFEVFGFPDNLFERLDTFFKRKFL